MIRESPHMQKRLPFRGAQNARGTFVTPTRFFDDELG